MNAQQEAVALWKFLEKRGFKPSIRSIGRTLRDQGIKFRDVDLQAWLSHFRESARNGAETKPPHTGSSGKQTGSGFARAVKVSLISKNVPTVRTPRNGVMKQPAFDLGPEGAPEIDFDRKRYAFPDGLPEEIPEPIDDVRDIARLFCRTLSNVKNEDKIRDGTPFYIEALVLIRSRGLDTRAAWKAFVDTIAAQEWKPLPPRAAKKALSFLPNGAATRQRPPMPRLAPGENARWDEGAKRWMVGNDNDPPTARELLAARRLAAEKQ